MKFINLLFLIILLSNNLFSQQELNDLFTIKFIDNYDGIITGGTSGHGLILHTTDGGDSWQKLDGFSGGLIRKSEYFYFNQLMLFTSDSLYVSSDGFGNFKALAYPEKFFLLDEHFLNKDIGWISGAGGFLYSTVDGGATWKLQYINSPGAGIGALFFVNKEYGWCANVNNIFLTKDGGLDWTIVENTSSTRSIFFVDSLIGYSLTIENVRKTINGGLNWSTLNLFPWKYLRDIYANPRGECFIVAAYDYGDASIFKSQNSGEEWSELILENFSSGMYGSITFSDYDHGWVGFFHGMIYRTTDAGKNWSALSLGLTDIANETNGNIDYNVSQNYPNPFNPSTTISFTIPSSQMVELKIYDMLGREIAELINEYRQTGSYSAQFNASHLASGIYFYKLKAGNYVQTKKLILLK